MKTILGAALVMVFCVFAITGCRSSDTAIETVVLEAETKEEIESRSVEKIPKDEIKIGIIHITDPADGFGYTYAHDKGLRKMQKDLGIADEQIIRKNNISENDEPAFDKAVRECVAEGCHIIFAPSWGYKEEIALAAANYPDIYFAYAGVGESPEPNLAYYYGREYEARYLSGIAAGMRTETGRIGFVAAWGKENSVVTSGINAFAMGVYSVNKNAKIYVKTVDSWFDAEKEEAVARELVFQGCDVIAQHSGTAYPVLVAEEAGVYGIGTNSDMSQTAPNAVLISAIWNWNIYYTEVIENLLNGIWQTSNYMGGMQEGLVRTSGLSNVNSLDVAAKVEEVQTQIFNRELVIFAGIIETNEGTLVGEEGKVMSDETIIGETNWYFKNVINE